MIIKKFTGKTEEDAVEAAKKELGSGVVIMNVKSVKRKGLAGLFGARQMGSGGNGFCGRNGGAGRGK